MKNKQVTLMYIKPYAFQHREDIFAMILKAGFEIIQISEESTLPKEQWEIFYAEHKSKPFFKNLIGFSCSGPIIAAILEKDNAIADFRTLIGASDPSSAAPGTIRNLYGNANLYRKGKPANAIHGSDSPERVKIEINLLFPGFNVDEEVNIKQLETTSII